MLNMTAKRIRRILIVALVVGAIFGVGKPAAARTYCGSAWARPYLAEQRVCVPLP